MYRQFKMLLCGDQAISLEFGEGISLETGLRVQRMLHAIKELKKPGIKELVPCYRSLLIYYDPLLVDLKLLEEEFRRVENNLSENNVIQAKRVKIPVLYGGEFGPDIGYVADYNGLSIDDVIDLHLKPVYISFNGFDPGTPLLLGLPKELHTPRLETPRLSVPKSSVAIGGVQTCVYAYERPGGWRIIGRTPLRMFDLERKPQRLVDFGDQVRFVRIDEKEYFEIFDRVEREKEPVSKYIEKS